jgi:Protein of unknown function (DUF1616)
VSSRWMPTRSDLLLLGITAACIAAVALSSARAVDVIVGLPLTIYLPGAALVSTLGPQRHHSGVVERQLWIVGASFGLTVLGGIVLNLAGGLTRSSWLAWVGAVVVVCIAFKLARSQVPSRSDTHQAARRSADVASLDSHEAASGEAADHGATSGSIRVSPRQATLLVAAGVICAAALVLSIHTDATTSRETFVQAWILPRPSEDVSSTSVQLGLENHLGGQRTFLVNVTVGLFAAPEVFSVRLADGASWIHVITRQPGERVESTVSTTSHPSLVLTTAYLASPVS